MVKHISSAVRRKENKLFELSLLVEDFELVTSGSKPQSLYLNLILKHLPRTGALEACEDGNFLFEISNHRLVAMACDILDRLDPVTNEELLEKVRRLLEDRD